MNPAGRAGAFTQQTKARRIKAAVYTPRLRFSRRGISIFMEDFCQIGRRRKRAGGRGGGFYRSERVVTYDGAKSPSENNVQLIVTQSAAPFLFSCPEQRKSALCCTYKQTICSLSLSPFVHTGESKEEVKRFWWRKATKNKKRTNNDSQT